MCALPETRQTVSSAGSAGDPWSWQEYEHPGTLVPKLGEPFGPFDSLLDVGGGGGTVGLGVWRVSSIYVLDTFPPKTTPKNFRLGDALDLVKLYGAKSFDIAQCAEVIEHLPKEKGPLLLAALEAVAKRLVIITTPNGFSEQDPALSPHEPWADNPYQKHLCGYTPEEFAERGYSILLNGGPGIGAQIIAWKDVRPKSADTPTVAAVTPRQPTHQTRARQGRPPWAGRRKPARG